MLAIVMGCVWAVAPADEADMRTAAARAVLAAVVEAGRANAKQAKPLAGDALTEMYVRAAARAAAEQPAAHRGPAFLLALGVGLDRSGLMRKNPLTRAAWAKLETDAERQKRLDVLGTPTAHGREDLCQHWAVSLALTVQLGEKGAEAAGVFKETLDLHDGGSGFSFADLAADLSGVALAARLMDDAKPLARVAERFRVADYVVAPKGLPEGLTRAQFERQFGSTGDERFLKQVETLKARVRELNGLAAEKAP